MGIILPELPEDYQKIWRFYITRYKKGEDGITRRKREVVKIPIGKRTTTMYTFCQLRKVMRKDVTPEHLLFCLVQDVVYFFDMSDNEIDNSMLFVTAFKAYHDDMQVELKKDKRKYKANEIYCIIHNITKVQAARRFQKVLSDRKIGRYYNFSLSVKENMKILEEHDIHFCKSRIYAFRNEYKETGFHYDYGDECEENTITSEVEHSNEPTIVEEDEGLVMEHNEVEVDSDDEAYIPKDIEINILKRSRLYKQHMKEHGLFISSCKKDYNSGHLLI